GMVLTLIGLVLLTVHRCSPSGWPFLIWGSIIVIAVLFERRRYRHIQHSQDERWQRTGERFEDPETGQMVEVLYDPATGERRYIPMSCSASVGNGLSGRLS
ncbi:MAG TPA: hypothetical protein VMP68_27960, partial [Candidatus Eisenbacteria bacterium]|nr:hypothetical protein [Candidatus Eisenbacteria bacterium]